MSLGAIQILIFGFKEDDYACKILPELRTLDKDGFIKIVDMLFATNDLKGNILALCKDELTAKEAMRLGSIAGILIGLGIPEGEDGGVVTRLENSELAENDFRSNLKEIAVIAEKIPKDSP